MNCFTIYSSYTQCIVHSVQHEVANNVSCICFVQNVLNISLYFVITIKSGILNPASWNPGEGLMADRGFTVKDYTDVLNIKLIIPAFLHGRDQLSEEEVITCI